MAAASASRQGLIAPAELRVVAARGLGAAGVAATALTVWAVRQSPVLRDAHQLAIVRGLLVACFIAVGIYTWWMRPHTRLGPLFCGIGFIYALGSLTASGRPFPFTIGRVVVSIVEPYLVYLFVVFPRDRLTRRPDRLFMILLVAASSLTWLVALALAAKLPPGGAFSDCGSRCPHNALALVRRPKP